MLSFGYANIVKDAGVEKFSVVYGPLYFNYIYNYCQIYLQLLWSRYIFRCFIWSLAFTPVVIYTKHMSSNTCSFISCDWTTYKTCLYPRRVSLEAVSSGTRYTWSNIMGLKAVFTIEIFLHPFVVSLYFAWCPFFIENLFVH